MSRRETIAASLFLVPVPSVRQNEQANTQAPAKPGQPLSLFGEELCSVPPIQIRNTHPMLPRRCTLLLLLFKALLPPQSLHARDVLGLGLAKLRVSSCLRLPDIAAG